MEITIGNWSLGKNTITYEPTKYAIPVQEIRTEAGLRDWYYHLRNKTWFDTTQSLTFAQIVVVARITFKAFEPVALGDYGPVLIMRGKYKGQIGLYDDDDSDLKAIVYLGVPFVEGYNIIPRAYMKSVEKHEPTVEFVKAHGPEAEMLGVRSSRK